MIDFSKLSKTAKQKQVDKFLVDYAAICKVNQLQFIPSLDIKNGGIQPKIDIVEYKDGNNDAPPKSG